MKKYFYFIILSLFTVVEIGCFPQAYGPQTQRYQFKGKYKSSFDTGEIEIYPWYHYVTSRKSNGEYIVRTFFPETKQITSYTTFESKEFKMRNGLATRWFDDGSKEYEGQYVNGERSGLWRFFHLKKFGDDLASKEGNYDTGKETGIWKTYDTKGRLASETEYVNGLKEGSFITYDSLSNVINEGVYRADTVFQESNPHYYDIGSESLPEFSNCDHMADRDERRKCTQKGMLEYIYKNIEYPHFAREYNVQGSALVRFYVDKDGSVKGVDVKRGICQSIANECRRIIEEMPDWHKPGMQDGKPVKVFFDLPIRFNLE